MVRSLQESANTSHFVKTLTYNVSHDAEFVQRGLSIEEDDVSVYQVSFNDITKPQLLSDFLTVSIFQKPDAHRGLIFLF